MKLRVAVQKLAEAQVDTILTGWFEDGEGPAAAVDLDKASGGLIGELVSSGDLKGKEKDVAVVYPRGAIPARRVIVVGLGKTGKLTLDAVRQAMGAGIRKARDLGARQAATALIDAGKAGLAPTALAQAAAEGVLLGLYQYAAQKASQEPLNEIESLVFCVATKEKKMVEDAVRVAEASSAGVCLARDLVNGAPAQVTPTFMAQAAQEIAKRYGMQITVGDRSWAAERKMGGFLAVAKGAGEEPRFIVMEHNPAKSKEQPLVIVGKGLTFDSGGISIKPSEKMEEMKSDMAGAAAVLGTMEAIGQLKLPQRVIGIAACTENMPDAHAYHPADVITFSNGKTAEVISTDAEGRMVLGDALVYAQQYNPKAVIDLATLTGACVIALGEAVAAGLFCTDDWLRDRLLDSGTTTHERLWPLPLWDDYKTRIRSMVADMKNTGGRAGGVGTSAVFLKEFIDYPWAHIDMAGMALYGKVHETPYIPAGGSGYGVRLLVDLIRNWQ